VDSERTGESRQLLNGIGYEWNHQHMPQRRHGNSRGLVVALRQCGIDLCMSFVWDAEGLLLAPDCNGRNIKQLLPISMNSMCSIHKVHVKRFK
jgi:hypothetical protein